MKKNLPWLMVFLILPGCVVYDAAYVSTPVTQHNEGSIVYAPRKDVETLDLAGKMVKLKLMNQLPDDSIQLAAIDRSNLVRKLGAIIVDANCDDAVGYVTCYHFVVAESTHESSSFFHHKGFDSQTHDRTETVEIALRIEFWQQGQLKYTVNRSRRMSVNTERYRSSGNYEIYWCRDRDISQYTTYDTFSIEKGLLDGMRQLWDDFVFY